ncbi:hypothetical protein LG634_07280 [Streptomyces bambusae]|uniref:hypothetical protein n=1 Tax=Streptomyces bambusae TaxID=1550616 RepID=UPI001CFE17D1|nr:hypothetical protein [Streptomyces bambusae]MCB5164634.1 hypothetical protein [Streptomyces bambusae]
MRTWRTWRRHRPQAAPSAAEQQWSAAVAAADWCVRRAYGGGYSGIPGVVSVADVQQCADEDFGTPGVTAGQAAAAVREYWYVRGCASDLVTDAFDRQYCP